MIPIELLNLLNRFGIKRYLDTNQILFEQDSISDGIYYLESGKLGVYREENGERTCLERIDRGEIIGEIGAVTGHVRTATVIAEEPSLLFHIPEKIFHEMLNGSPELANQFQCIILDRVTKSDISKVTLQKSYQRAQSRVQLLTTEKSQIEELLRMREELSDMIVHDLRNPLGVISGNVTILKHILNRQPMTEYAEQAFCSLERTLCRMKNLVDTLLDISQLEANALQITLTPINVSELLHMVLREEKPLADMSQIHMEVTVDSPDLVMTGDASLLQRVILNLVDNAIKFTPPEGWIRLKGEATTEGIRISVHDSGPGIPVEERVRIFEKFTQIKGQGSHRRGSGLGLTFCQMAVESHGGSIWVDSDDKDQGSRFVFVIPSRSHSEPQDQK